MKPIEFPGCNNTVAKDQPQYVAMPCIEFDDPEGTRLFCYQLTWMERIKLLLTGKLWQYILTFSQPQQPQRFMVDKPKCVGVDATPDELTAFASPVSCCSACGQDHEIIVWTPSWLAMDYGFTHQGECPTTETTVFAKELEQEGGHPNG